MPSIATFSAPRSASGPGAGFAISASRVSSSCRYRRVDSAYRSDRRERCWRTSSSSISATRRSAGGSFSESRSPALISSCTSRSRASPSTSPSARNSSESPATDSASSTVGNDVSTDRSFRAVTRIWCTASHAFSRTRGSQCSSESRCVARECTTRSRPVGCLASLAGLWLRGSEPMARASLETLDAGRAPAPRSSERAFLSRRVSPPVSSNSHSAHSLVTCDWCACERTRSSQNSASESPSSSYTTVTVRAVLISATGISGRSRTIASTALAMAAGTGPSAGASEKSTCSSRRASPPAGRLRCQPLSVPPVRRRSVMPCAARSWAGVSR